MSEEDNREKPAPPFNFAANNTLIGSSLTPAEATPPPNDYVAELHKKFLKSNVEKFLDREVNDGNTSGGNNRIGGRDPRDIRPDAGPKGGTIQRE